MRLVATSDWHGVLPDAIPDGDVLLLAGDLLSMNHELEAQHDHFVKELVPYLAALPHERILLVAGNHDFLFASDLGWQDELPLNVTYLRDEPVVIDGVRFWGTPWSTFLPGWVFMEHEPDLEQHLERNRPDTDVLVVHGHAIRGARQDRGALVGGRMSARRACVTGSPATSPGTSSADTSTSRTASTGSARRLSTTSAYLDEHYKSTLRHTCRP